MRHAISSGNAFSSGRLCGSWLVVSALLVAALLVPPLLLPLLLVLALDPLVSATRRDPALALAPVLPALSRPRTPRGPPRD